MASWLKLCSFFFSFTACLDGQRLAASAAGTKKGPAADACGWRVRKPAGRCLGFGLSALRWPERLGFPRGELARVGVECRRAVPCRACQGVLAAGGFCGAGQGLLPDPRGGSSEQSQVAGLLSPGHLAISVRGATGCSWATDGTLKHTPANSAGVFTSFLGCVEKRRPPYD